MSAVNHKRNVAAARKAYDKTVEAVFALAPNGHTRFSECLALAGAALREKHEAAHSRLIGAEADAVAACKAWLGSFGRLVWYR